MATNNSINENTPASQSTRTQTIETQLSEIESWLEILIPFKDFLTRAKDIDPDQVDGVDLIAMCNELYCVGDELQTFIHHEQGEFNQVLTGQTHEMLATKSIMLEKPGGEPLAAWLDVLSIEHPQKVQHLVSIVCGEVA